LSAIVLDKKNNQLSMKEAREGEGILIKGGGQFVCKYLGNKYPSTIFYADEEA